MSVPPTADDKPEFMLIFRDTELEKQFPDEQVKQAMQQFNEWLERWSNRGYIRSGQPLGPEGRVLAKAQQRVVTEGPFAETKEVVGGYVMVAATDLEEATRVAADWPLMEYGSTVEVRPVLKFCPAMEKVGLEHFPLSAH